MSADEFEEMLEVESERAKDRIQEGGSAGGKGKEKFPDPSTGQARDKAAEKVTDSTQQVVKTVLRRTPGGR